MLRKPLVSRDLILPVRAGQGSWRSSQVPEVQQSHPAALLRLHTRCGGSGQRGINTAFSSSSIVVHRFQVSLCTKLI